MSKVQFIILGCVAVIFFVTYLLISRFSKINGPSKSDYSKTMDALEQDRPSSYRCDHKYLRFSLYTLVFPLSKIMVLPQDRVIKEKTTLKIAGLPDPTEYPPKSYSLLTKTTNGTIFCLTLIRLKILSEFKLG